MKKNFFDIFDPYTDAVVALKNGGVIYSNSSAKKLFGVEEISPDVFPPLLAKGGEKSLSGTVLVNGESYSAISSEFEDCRIITVLDHTGVDTEDFPELLRSFVDRLKSELAVMQMNAGLIRGRTSKLEDSKLKQYLAMLDHSCGKMARIVVNAARMYMWGEGGETLSLSYFDLAELCAGLVETVNYVTDHRVNVVFEAREREFPFYADADKIEILLMNLLSNSLKYTPDGGRIRLALSRSGYGAMLTVSDNGSGMPKEVLATVFERYKEPVKLDDPRSGIGFGLPIVQKIAVMHGGSAVLQSAENIGTTVKVFLPEREGEDILRSDVMEHRSNTHRILTEFADVLGYQKYISRNMD